MKHFLVPVEIVLAIIFSLMLAVGCSGQTFGSFVHDQPFLAADTAGGGLIPTANLWLWLKPESITGTNGAALANWPDSSGNGHYGTRLNGVTDLPLVTNDCVAGFSAAMFTSSTDGLALTNTKAFTRNQTGNTLFVYMRFGTLGDVILDNQQGAGGPSRLKFSHFSLSTGAVRGCRVDGGAFANSDPFTMTTGWVLYTVRVTWSSATAMVRTNGVLALLDETFSTAGATSDTDQTTESSLGCDYYGNNSIRNSEIAEVIYYRGALSDSDVTTIESYFSTKYALGW